MSSWTAILRHSDTKYERTWKVLESLGFSHEESRRFALIWPFWPQSSSGRHLPRDSLHPFAKLGFASLLLQAALCLFLALAPSPGLGTAAGGQLAVPEPLKFGAILGHTRSYRREDCLFRSMLAASVCVLLVVDLHKPVPRDLGT